MKCCVTGADGYLGKGIVSKLLDEGAEVVASGFRLAEVDERAERVEGDIFRMEDPCTELGDPDVLVHLAWRDGFDHGAPSHIEDLPKHCRFVEAVAQGSA